MQWAILYIFLKICSKMSWNMMTLFNHYRIISVLLKNQVWKRGNTPSMFIIMDQLFMMMKRKKISMTKYKRSKLFHHFLKKVMDKKQKKVIQSRELKRRIKKTKNTKIWNSYWNKRCIAWTGVKIKQDQFCLGLSGFKEELVYKTKI